MKYRDIVDTRDPMKRKVLVEQAYLDWYNDYLTIAKFSSDYDCTPDEALALIEEGRHWNHHHHHHLPKIVEITE